MKRYQKTERVQICLQSKLEMLHICCSSDQNMSDFLIIPPLLH